MLATAIVLVHLGACALLALFGAHRVWLLIDFLRRPRRGKAREQGDAHRPAEELPFVTVQLPLYNERSVCGRLIDAVCALEYPRERFEVQVLDDSTDETADVVAERVAHWRGLGVAIEHIRRERREGYKAGALQHGLERARGELIAIFDADFVPRPDFLKAMVPAFADPDVGMVQARWGHLNRGASWLTRAQALFLDAHFTIEHQVRGARGRFFNFNGTAGIWRRRAIEEAGGWDAATLTEDLDLSFRAQLRGSRFRYLDDVEVPAELPEEVNAFKGQQHRWAKGSIQTARRLLPAVWRARLPLAVKLDATLKLSQNVAFLLLFIVVVTMPANALSRAVGASAWERAGDLGTLGLGTLPVALHFLLAQVARGTTLSRALLHLPLALGLGAALSVNNARAVVEGLFGIGSNAFVRTPKRGASKQSAYHSSLSPLVVVELVLGAAHLAAAVVLVAAGAGWTTPFLFLFGVSLVWLGGSSALGPIVRLLVAREPAALPVGSRV